MGTDLLITFCPIVVGLLMLSVHWGVTPLTGSILFNVYVVLLAIVLLWQGTVTKRVGLVNGCIFTFLAMIAARFFDPTFSFVERGFTFMVTGVAIFAVNLFYMWRKQSQQAQVNTSVARANRRLRRRQTLGDDEHIEVTDTGEHTESAGNYTSAPSDDRTGADAAKSATVKEDGNMAYTAREQESAAAVSSDKTTARKGNPLMRNRVYIKWILFIVVGICTLLSPFLFNIGPPHCCKVAVNINGPCPCRVQPVGFRPIIWKSDFRQSRTMAGRSFAGV